MALLTRRIVRFSILCALIVAVLAGCAAQPVVLTGVVTDAYTGAPLSGVTVAIGDQMLTTDEQGRFQTERWRPEDTLALQAPLTSRSTCRSPINPAWARAVS